MSTFNATTKWSKSHLVQTEKNHQTERKTEIRQQQKKNTHKNKTSKMTNVLKNAKHFLIGFSFFFCFGQGCVLRRTHTHTPFVCAAADEHVMFFVFSSWKDPEHKHTRPPESHHRSGNIRSRSSPSPPQNVFSRVFFFLMDKSVLPLFCLKDEGSLSLRHGERVCVSIVQTASRCFSLQQKILGKSNSLCVRLFPQKIPQKCDKLV